MRALLLLTYACKIVSAFKGTELHKDKISINSILIENVRACASTNMVYENYAWKELEEAPLPNPEVTQLDLKGNKLSTLPQEYAKLDQLISLNICSNRFEKPPQMPPHLQILNASHNGICYLPPMHALTHLNLNNNHLYDFPFSLFELVLLQDLDLSENKISRMPKYVSKFQRLTCLNISHNCLRKLPAELCSLPLDSLFLEHNHLKRLPDNFGHLSQLKDLNLSNNKLKKLPITFQHLTITELCISNNQLKTVERLPRGLERLNCANNSLTELSNKLYSLTHLCASSNLLRKMPPYPLLEEANLTDNKLVEFWHGSAKLRKLHLSSNLLTSFPSFEHMPMLHTLSLCHNRLTTIPSSQNSEHLTTLRLSYNFLRHLPALSTRLERVAFDNNLFGKFPSQTLANLKLKELHATPNPYKKKHRRMATFRRWKAKIPLLEEKWFQ